MDFDTCFFFSSSVCHKNRCTCWHIFFSSHFCTMFSLAYCNALVVFANVFDGIVRSFKNNFYLDLIICWFLFFSILILFRLPLLLMSVAYFKIICVLWKSDTIPGHRESCNQMHTIRKFLISQWKSYNFFSLSAPNQYFIFGYVVFCEYNIKTS